MELNGDSMELYNEDSVFFSPRVFNAGLLVI